MILRVVGLLTLVLLPVQFRVPLPSPTPPNPIAGARQAGGGTAVPNAYWVATGATIATPSQCGSQLASTSTAAQINTAISDCNSGGGGVVSLDSGTFTIADAINMKSNVVLRGEGMATILNVTDNSGASWYWGSSGVLTFQGSYGASASDAVPPIASATAGTDRTWTGTNGQSNVYTQGATIINLGSTPTGLSVGDTLILWQSDEPDGNLPMAGFFFSDKTGASNAVAGFGTYNDHDGAMEQRSLVTNINGTAVTISPGLLHPTGTWQSGLTPKARWLTVSQTIHDAGVENLRITTTSLGTHQCVICIAFGTNIWVTGVGLVPKFTSFHAGGSVDFVIVANDSQRVTIANNWISKAIGGGFNTTTSYGIVLQETFHARIQNNIFDNVESPTELLIGSAGNLYGYNYEHYVGDDSQEGGIQQHDVANTLNLVEGNTYIKVWADHWHGNTAFGTYFRNHLTDRGVDLWSYQRWYNMVGNVIGATQQYKSLPTDSTKRDRFYGYAFRLGYAHETADANDSMGVSIDSGVWTSAFIWGNYTAVVGAGTFDSAEVPTTDPSFPNAVPGSQALPASLGYAARPGFFTITGIGTQPWPLHGPDVTGGAYESGHANKTPAQVMYDTAGGAIASFDPTLYGS